jgi:hypothetical protein
MKLEVFNENEWKTAEILIEKKNKNIIDYYCVNEITVYNKKYIVFMLEYANAEVFLFILFNNYIFIFI